MSDQQQAQRLPDNEDGIAGGAEASGKVCYWWYEKRWWLWLPGGYRRTSPDESIEPGEIVEHGWLADLSKHDVVEHEDGTITVSPSVGVSNHAGSRHGYLERGVWRDV